MRSSGLLAFSICLNIILAAGYGLLFRQPSLNDALVGTGSEISENPDSMSAPRTVVMNRPAEFSWEQLESKDFAVYIKNLQAIGCPSDTIRDLVVAEVEQQYALKKIDAVASVDMEWWRTSPTREFRATLRSVAEELDREKHDVLDALLGPGWAEKLVVEDYGERFTGEILSAVPLESQERIKEINRRYSALLNDASTGMGVVQIAEMRQLARAEIQALLSPAQFEEYLLRYSASAGALRRELDGFDVTQEEFRELFRKRDRLEQQRALQDLDASGGTSLAQDFRSVYESVLSQERNEEYRLYQDPVYRHSVDLVEELGLAKDSALAVYQVRQAAEQEHLAIQNDVSLSEQEKADALAAMRQERQDVLLELLGTENYRNFVVRDNYRRFMEELQVSEAYDLSPQ